MTISERNALLRMIGLIVLMVLLVAREYSLLIAWGGMVLAVVISVAAWTSGSQLRPLIGSFLVDLGFGLNMLAMAANGWFMPVAVELDVVQHHTTLHRYIDTNKMSLAFLCDIHKGFSLGDMLIIAGIAVYLGAYVIEKLREGSRREIQASSR